MSTLFDLTPADVADTSNDWYTPPWIFELAGLIFDVDVAAPVDASRRTVPARRYLTPLEDGLTADWEGLVWMNPPFSNIAPWAERFSGHDAGLALVPGHNAVWLERLLESAHGIAILRRVQFIRPEGVMGHNAWPTFLIARGDVAMEAASRVGKFFRA